ncbi:MAG: hypothetical protein ACPG7F_10095 [Aggregatilineales bacterium]
MFNNKLRYVVVFCLLAVFAGLSTLMAQDDTTVIDLNWSTLTGLGLAEQFVFLMDENGDLYKVTADSPLSDLQQPIYTMPAENAADFVFDPFQLTENPLGPLPAGEALGMTLGDYLGGRGTGTYTLDGDMATVDASFDRLMPNAVYTLWCSDLTRPPEFNIVDKPCGAQDGSENNFMSDEYGHLEINMSFPALAMPTETGLSVIAIAWHSDGETYGEHPGDFGVVSFVPLRALLVPNS